MNASERKIAPAHETQRRSQREMGGWMRTRTNPIDWSVCLCYHRYIACDKSTVLKAVKVRIYPTQEQQRHLAQAFGCVRWVWNQSLATGNQRYCQGRQCKTKAIWTKIHCC